MEWSAVQGRRCPFNGVRVDQGRRRRSRSCSQRKTAGAAALRVAAMIDFARLVAHSPQDPSRRQWGRSDKEHLELLVTFRGRLVHGGDR